MGVDKASLLLGDRPMIDYSISALRSLRRMPEEIVIATSPDATHTLSKSLSLPNSSFDHPIVRILVDSAPFKGPLAGLQTVLNDTSAPRALVLACDMPFVSGALLDRLLDEEKEMDHQAVVVFRARGRLHPFPGFYSRSIAPTCSDLLAQKKQSMHALLARVPTLALDLPEWASPDCLDSINTQSDLDLARKRLTAADDSDATHSGGAK